MLSVPLERVTGSVRFYDREVADVTEIDPNGQTGFDTRFWIR
jgi:hypothetical protein